MLLIKCSLALSLASAWAEQKENSLGNPAPVALGCLVRLTSRLREELGVNTTCGASNVSFGLPNRHLVTGTFLSMAMAAGMTSAIMSPLHAEVKAAVMGADVLMGNDENCAAWISEYREASSAGRSRSARQNRRRGNSS